MYDSLLYGYGLTCFVFDKIDSLIDSSNPCKKYFSIISFLEDFINAEKHKRILRDFNRYFDLNNETNEGHEEARNYLKSEINNILKYGFERWVSKNIFNENNKIPKIADMYIYMLYNYWYHLIHKEILSKPSIANKLNQIGENIINGISDKSKIYTVNFDSILDETLKPKHIHGRFIIPLDNIDELIIPLENEKEFEYSYLFGSNGFEKAKRIQDFSKLSQKFYDLDFFFDNKLYLGHLLIFGLSFSKTEIITADFQKKYPQYENWYSVKSVDGHILLILKKMIDENQIKKITISYYRTDELEYYRELFSLTDFGSIVEYADSKEIYFN